MSSPSSDSFPSPSGFKLPSPRQPVTRADSSPALRADMLAALSRPLRQRGPSLVDADSIFSGGHGGGGTVSVPPTPLPASAGAEAGGFSPPRAARAGASPAILWRRTQHCLQPLLRPLSLTRIAVFCVALAAAAAALRFEFGALARFYALQAVYGSVRLQCAPCGCASKLPPAVAALRVHCAEPLLPSARVGTGAGEPFPASLSLHMSVANCTAAAATLADSGGGEGAAAAAAVPPRVAAPAAGAPRTLFHLYVRADLGARLPPWQVTTLLSILATQPAGSFQVVVWSPQAESPLAPALAPLLAAAPGVVSYRVFDAVTEASGSPLAGTTLLRFRDGRGWADSDIFRLIVLWRYGGVYLDLDVWLFRDVSPLLAWEWTTEFAGDGLAGNGIVRLNNAVQHFFARSPALVRLMELAVATPPVLRSWMYGPLLLDRAYGYGAGVAAAAPTSAPSVGATAAVAAAATAATLPPPPPPLRPFGALPWCFFHGMFSVGDEASPLREITAEHLLGSADWSQSAVLRHAFGLHMHGLPGGGRLAEPGSVIAVVGARTRTLAASRGVNLPDPSRRPQAHWREVGAGEGEEDGEGRGTGDDAALHP